MLFTSSYHFINISRCMDIKCHGRIKLHNNIKHDAMTSNGIDNDNIK